MKRTSINPNSGDELSVPPYHPGRSSPNTRRPTEGIGSSRIRELHRRMSLEISSSSGEGRSSKKVDEIETDSNMDPGTSVVPFISENESSDESSSEESELKRTKISHRTKAESYPIDFMDCETTYEDLHRLMMEYSILDDIVLRIPGKGDIPSRPPQGFVTLYLKCFRLGVRLPLQPYFANILGKLNLSPSQLNPNR